MSKNSYIGECVRIEGQGSIFDGVIEGIVLPNSDNDVYIIKLDSGYNVTIRRDNVKKIESLKKSEVRKIESKHLESAKNPKLKSVAIISSGGTISSKVDYSTGGVSSQFSASDLVNVIPEIKSIANLDTYVVSNIFSEDITSKEWLSLAKKIEELASKYSGFIITHGTDTMHYTASMLSFLLKSLNVPVVLVGSQRSSDRPSSDAAANLVGALLFVTNSSKSGVFIAMHDNSSDDTIAVHLGTRARKMHSSRRDAFKSINSNPLARVQLKLVKGVVESFSINYDDSWSSLHDINSFKCESYSKVSNDVTLIKFYPDMDLEFFKYVLDKYRVVIIEGVGFGNVSAKLIPLISKSKAHVFMTTQTINGTVSHDVYSRGIELRDAGVVSLNDMISECALSKARVLYANYKDNVAKEMMIKNLCQEFSDRSLY